MPLRVVFAEDNYLVREGRRRCWQRRGGRDRRAPRRASTSTSAVDEHGPDAVLTDIRMPPSGTDEGIRGREADPDRPSRDRRRRPVAVRGGGVRLRAAQGRRGRPRLPVEGARGRRRGAGARADRGRPRRERARPEDRRGPRRRREGAPRALAARARLTDRERARCSVTWRRDRTTPRSRSRCSSPSAPSRSTSTPCSTSSA